MPVNSVPTMGWTRRSAAISVLLVLEEQRKRAGERVVKLREAKNWTQEDLAARSGLSVKTVSRFENGRHEGRNETVRKLARGLKVNEVDITGPPPAPLGLDVETQPVAVDGALGDVLAQILSAVTKQNGLLERQSEILESIEAKLGQDIEMADRIEAATESLGGTAAQLDAQVQETIRGLAAAPPPKAPTSRKTAPRRTPRA